MSAFSRGAIAHFQYHKRQVSKILDHVFIQVLRDHKLEAEAHIYLEALEEPDTTLTRNLTASVADVTNYGRITKPEKFYGALDLELTKDNHWFSLTSVNYFSRIRREILLIARAMGMDDFEIMFLMGRIDKFILSKEPSYIPIKARS